MATLSAAPPHEGDQLQQLNVRLPRRSIRLAQRIARKRGATVAAYINSLIEADVRAHGVELTQELERFRAEAARQEQLLAQDLHDALRPVD